MKAIKKKTVYWQIVAEPGVSEGILGDGEPYGLAAGIDEQDDKPTVVVDLICGSDARQIAQVFLSRSAWEKFAAGVEELLESYD